MKLGAVYSFSFCDKKWMMSGLEKCNVFLS